MAASAVGTALEMPCSPSQLLDESIAATLPVNSAAATRTVLSSVEYANLMTSLAVGSSLTFNSVSDHWQFNRSNCTVRVTSVSVAFDIRGPSGTASTVVFNELANVSGITSVSFQTAAAHPVTHTSYGLWTGYEIESSGGPGGWWYVPSVSAPSNHCGATYFYPAVCVISIWLGQTNVAGGSSGISQTGTDQSVLCDWTLFTGWTCSSGYEAWYEFYPSNSVNCLGVSAGNQIVVNEYYLSGKYYLDLVDYSNGNGCAENSAMSMGSPNWAQFMAENPVLAGGNPPTPSFSSFTLNGLAVGAQLDLQNFNYNTYTQASNVNLGSLLFDSGPCRTPNQTKVK